jgi:hypothetical protein
MRKKDRARIQSAMGFERSPPGCRDCVHFHHHPHGNPMCTLAGFVVEPSSICDLWQTNDGDRFDDADARLVFLIGVGCHERFLCSAVEPGLEPGWVSDAALADQFDNYDDAREALIAAKNEWRHHHLYLTAKVLRSAP